MAANRPIFPVAADVRAPYDPRVTEPLASRIRGDGVDLQLYEWPGEGRPIFLAHATGFHARCWDQVVARLPGRHVYAIDMRGHGRSEKPEPPYPWGAFGRDVAAVAGEIGLRGAIGVGHSKGGFAVTMAAGLVPAAFASLLLVDPVIMERAAYESMGAPGEHFASRRRDRWASPEEMFERFRERPPFALWKAEVLRDYCRYGLLAADDGDGYVLACPPRIEAAVYAGSAGAVEVYDAIETIDVPVTILRARERAEDGAMDMNTSPTAPKLASHFRKATDVPLPHLSHFIPMEQPELVARYIMGMEG